MDSPTPPFAGHTCTLSGRSLVVPPLSMRSARLLMPKIEALKTIDGMTLAGEHIDTVLEVVIAAIQRNYPDITAEEIGEWLDFGNIKELFFAALGQAALDAPSAATPAN